MNPVPVALDARGSAEQPAEAKTIASPIAELHARIHADGVAPAATLAFVDEGRRGASLIRPARDRRRDVAAAGGVNRRDVHWPDRLARNDAHPAILLEELTRVGVEVIFLNHPFGQTPEDQPLVPVHGVIAEDARAKSRERSRRGKRDAARRGRVSVLGHAPSGSRDVNAGEGGEARLDVIREEARVVRRVFRWIGQERRTLGEVRRHLQREGIPTRTGKPVWHPKTLRDRLRQPASIGQAACGRTRSRPLQPRLRAPRGRPAQSRRG